MKESHLGPMYPPFEKGGAWGDLPLRYLLRLNFAKHTEVNPPHSPFFKGGGTARVFENIIGARH